MVKPICPHCEVALERRSSHGVFRYSCPSCYGFAVHFGALKKILDVSEVKLLWKASEQSETNGSTKCPHCRQSTRMVFHGHEMPVELDVCRRCDIVWLDTGEWQDIEKLPKFKRPKAEQELNRVYADVLLAMDREKHRPLDVGGIEAVQGSDLHPGQWVTALLGLPTEHDNGYLRVSPWVTVLLILTCSVFSILAFKNLEAAIATYGHLASAPVLEQFRTSITSFFIHGNWFHLLSNMYFLWVFGDNVEDHLGHFDYALLIFAATIGSSFAFGHFDPNSSTIPSIGASGGIFGVVAYYLCKFPSKKFLMLFWFRFWISVPAYVIGLLFLLKEVLGAYAEMNRMGGGVAHLAHLGGAVVGVVWAMLVAPEKVDRS